MAPFGRDRETRHRLRHALCAAAVAGVHAIREVVPDARMVHVEPLIQVVPPADRPDLADEAREERGDDACFAWDVLAGRRHPELGGAPEVLDVVGANCYAFGQMEYREQGPHMAMAPHDPRIRPLAWSCIVYALCDVEYLVGAWDWISLSARRAASATGRVLLRFCFR
jgi:hypothetical protein